MSNPHHDVREDDLVGRVFVETASLPQYYKHVDTFATFLKDGPLGDNITGCFMNCIKGNFRLKYFARKPSSARSNILGFIDDRGLTLEKENAPENTVLAKDKGGVELEEEFRGHLSTYSWIGVDLLNNDRQYVRRLCAIFRWRVFPAGTSFREYFEPSFQSRSEAYRSLSTEAKEAFWMNLQRWPNMFQTDWAHMFVNFVIGHDWGNPPLMFARKPPARIPLINKRCDSVQIPRSLSPD